MRILLALILLGLILTAALLPSSQPSQSTGSSFRAVIWNAFLFAVPALLAVLMLAGLRWALILVVMYGTIGLALDLSTLIQQWHTDHTSLLLLSGISGLLNASLITLAGGAFLDVRSGRAHPAQHSETSH